MEHDWTVDPATRRSNSSPRFRELVDAVAALIRNSAHDIVRGRLESVAGLIVAQLAHKHGLAPRSDEDRSEMKVGPGG